MRLIIVARLCKLRSETNPLSPLYRSAKERASKPRRGRNMLVKQQFTTIN
jgi:hypothetical protein